MFDTRLNILLRAGYSKNQVTQLAKHLPDSVLTEIGESETPAAAMHLMSNSLAENKASVDTDLDPENPGDGN